MGYMTCHYYDDNGVQVLSILGLGDTPESAHSDAGFKLVTMPQPGDPPRVLPPAPGQGKGADLYAGAQEPRSPASPPQPGPDLWNHQQSTNGGSYGPGGTRTAAAVMEPPREYTREQLLAMDRPPILWANKDEPRCWAHPKGTMNRSTKMEGGFFCGRTHHPDFPHWSNSRGYCNAEYNPPGARRL